jgi:TM2 domain-containing membrane protein YozV
MSLTSCLVLGLLDCIYMFIITLMYALLIQYVWSEAMQNDRQYIVHLVVSSQTTCPP